MHEEARSPGIWPERVLITNDDGIEDEDRLLALASAFAARESKVIVAVPQENRSGTGHQKTLVARLASSPPVRQLEAGTYLTVALHDQGFIVITPMRADEHHEVLLEALAN
jgi:hypothetical protein